MPQRYELLDEVVARISRLVLQKSRFVFRFAGPPLFGVERGLEARYFPRRVAELEAAAPALPHSTRSLCRERRPVAAAT